MGLSPQVLALSFQARYRCRHSGACCTAGWPIPVEPSRAPLLCRLNASGIVEAIPEQNFLLGTDWSGACAFYDRGARCCTAHRELGPAALPVSCAHFPRRLVIDEDRVAVSLSHFCPTVAELLFSPEDDAVSIVEAPSLLAGIDPLEGLDARGAWPPLLRPGMLTDRPVYRRWESFVVETLAAAEGGPEAALARAWGVTEQVVRWKPGMGPLEAWVEERTRGSGPQPSEVSLPDHRIPDLLDPFARPVGRYLAARAFGNWAAYQGDGLLAVLRDVRGGLDILRAEAVRQRDAARRPLDAPLLKEAIRRADLRILHLVA
ncbi:MAG TPA: hypothetical protein VK911_03260 [Vicinamibacterales bacterium]|nr:hypothetical protein [Vicinamibacterales bacterium]